MAKKGWADAATLRTLWGIAKSPELRLTDEELHLVVQAQTGKCSMKELTQKEISRVAFVLGQMKDSAKKGRKVRQPVYQGGTENQQRKLYKLAESCGWSEKRIKGLCRKMFRVDSPKWLDYGQMSKFIEAVKAISKREEEENAGLQNHTDG